MSPLFSSHFHLPPLTGGGFWVAFAQVALVYYGFAAAIHWLIPRFFAVESVQVGQRRPGQVRKEALLSIGAVEFFWLSFFFFEFFFLSLPKAKLKTEKKNEPPPPLLPGPIAVKALVFTCVEALSRRPGLTKLYHGEIEGVGGWAYAALSVAALDVLHDSWFYWTHRWMHSWKPLYRRVHSLHHESTVPTAFTGYAFHPVEGAIVFLNEILVTFLFPIHSGLHRAYHLWTTVIHNGGHAGYEIAPFIPSLAAVGTALVEGASAVAGRVKASTTKGGRPSSSKAAALEETSKKARAALNTVRHHDMHHRFPFAHFSLYFTHWDRLLGTEHAGYRAAVEAHFAPKSSAKVEEEEEGVDGGKEAAVSERTAAASPPVFAVEASSAKAEAATKATKRGGLERLASAMEEYALLSQRKQQQQRNRGGSGGRSHGGKGSGRSSSSSSEGGGAKSSAAAPARRPRSPGIGAWRPTEGAEITQQQQQQRRSSRLARAA